MSGQILYSNSFRSTIEMVISSYLYLSEHNIAESFPEAVCLIFPLTCRHKYNLLCFIAPITTLVKVKI
jgi:hypothetical protein